MIFSSDVMNIFDTQLDLFSSDLSFSPPPSLLRSTCEQDNLPICLPLVRFPLLLTCLSRSPPSDSHSLWILKLSDIPRTHLLNISLVLATLQPDLPLQCLQSQATGSCKSPPFTVSIFELQITSFCPLQMNPDKSRTASALHILSLVVHMWFFMRVRKFPPNHNVFLNIFWTYKIKNDISQAWRWRTQELVFLLLS